MPRIIFICGLPGSGKTFYGTKLSKETGFDFIDDIKTSVDLDNNILANKDCIVSDPNFVIDCVRNKAIKHLKLFKKLRYRRPRIELKTEWIFFENNPEQCIKNVELRNDGRKVIEFIKMFSKTYNIPANANIIKVYSG